VKELYRILKAVLPETNEVQTVSTFEGGEGAYRGISGSKCAFIIGPVHLKRNNINFSSKYSSGCKITSPSLYSTKWYVYISEAA